MIKLVAIDLDGTLLNSEKIITEKNRQSIALAKQQGVKIVICTGRPLSSIHEYLKTLNLEEVGDYSITFNGGLVQKNNSGEIISQVTITRSQIQRVYDLAQTLALPLDVIAEERVLHLVSPSVTRTSIYSTLNPLLKVEERTIDNLKENETYNKMVIATEVDYLDQQILKIPSAFYEAFNIFKSRTCLLEILGKEVSKSKGIQRLIRHLNIQPDEVMAIGDEANDLDMIQFAGIGVAMKNASPQVKEAADVITNDCDHDGVAEILTEYVIRSKEDR